MTEPTPGLLDEIGRLPPTRFAVVDGALFANLPADLAAERLEGRPLYFEGADVEVVTAGPYLVRLDDYGAARRLLDLIGDRRTGVFWSSSAGTDPLYRHLRRLNTVRISLVHEPRREADYRTVLFRHGDPNVIAATVAVMGTDQRQQLLGQSPALVYSAGPAGVRVLRAGTQTC